MTAALSQPVAPAVAATGLMNILLISHSRNDPDAGASRVYHQLGEGLTARGHSVETLHYEDLGLPRPAILAKTIEKLAMPRWIAWQQRRRDFKEIDVVVAPSGMGYALFDRLRGRPGRPLLVNHQHGLTLFDHQARLTEALAGHVPFPLHKRMAEWPPIAWDFRGARLADLSVLQNLRDLDHLQRYAPAGRAMTMIPPALHPAMLAASAMATPPETRDRRHLIWFGSWGARKGAFVIPPAFEHVLDAVPDAVLTIGGTGLPEGEVLSQFSARAARQIRILPRLSLADQIAELQRHSIFLFPSISEGFGFAVLEAMALGLTAVTTLTGFGADSLRHRETGLIVPQGSALHLADGIMEAIQDDQLRIAMARRGQILARGFTLERMAAAYETAFAAARAAM
jgi:glycosyltransferase involved in cell wall biosynthesis